MHSIKKILILYHRNIGDEAALERALSLAHRVGGSVIVSEIMDPNDGRRLSWFLPPSPRSQRALARARAEREAHFRRLLASTERLNVTVRCKVLADGPAYESVIKSVVKENIDLVIATGAHMDLAKASARRSLVAKLVQGCPCPVWIADPDAAGGLRRLVAAVSLPENPEDDREATRRILHLVAELHHIEQCRVDILHAWDFTGAQRDRARSDISREDLADMVAGEAEARRARIGALLSRAGLDGDQVEIHIERGPANFVISEFVARNHVDLVVMGSGTRSNLKSLFAGNVAKEVCEDVPCSVLAVGQEPESLPAPEHQLA
jgi:nucleotide-binding universal stress UspA family protein